MKEGLFLHSHRHQCRYCAHCVVTIDGIQICESDDMPPDKERGDGIPYPFKRPNRCRHWLFNEIAADFGGNASKVYRPRRPSPFRQPRLFDMPTDKQREVKK